jgi:hypothetical protein
LYTNIIQFIGFETTFLLHILFFLRFCQKLQSYPLNENITRNETWQTIHLNTRYNVKWPNALFLLFIQSNSEISNGQFNSYLKLMGICWYVAFLTSNMKLLYMCFFSKQMRDRRGHNRGALYSIMSCLFLSLIYDFSDLQLHMQSISISTIVVSSNPAQARCTRYNIMW